MFLICLLAGGLFLFCFRSNVVINTDLTIPGIRAEFNQALADTKAYYEQLATRIPSSTQTERYRWLGTAPSPREWGTGRVAQGLRSEKYDVENGEYESTIEVDRKEIEDDQIGGIRLRVTEMAQRTKLHKDELIESLLNAGGTAGYNSYDGVTYFSSAHVSGDSGNQSNDLTYDASNTAAVTTEEFKKSLMQAIQAMVAFKDDKGRAMRIAPSGLAVVVPPALIFTALEAINATLINTTTNVLQNNTVANAAAVIPLPGLSSAATYYLCKTDVPVRPFIFQDRIPMEFEQHAEGSENAFFNNRFFFGTRARYALAYGMWQYCIRTLFN